MLLSWTEIPTVSPVIVRPSALVYVVVPVKSTGSLRTGCRARAMTRPGWRLSTGVGGAGGVGGVGGGLTVKVTGAVTTIPEDSTPGA